MPKKFQGENSKAAVARARKEATKLAESERRAKEEEDALWVDNDKHVLRKQQRKIDKDLKRQEQTQRKIESKQLLAEEMTGVKSSVKIPIKLTQAQIHSSLSKKTQVLKKDLMHDEVPLEENINRLIPDTDSARSVDEAIAILSLSESPVDRHPEKRLKAAYTAFEEHRLPQLKLENQNLRLSQLKQMIKKEWMKSPENPLNQQE